MLSEFFTFTQFKCSLQIVEKHYRDLLKVGLSKRISLNSKYSLRAYARDLSISSGQLSLVLSGRKGISTKKAAKISEVLKLNENEKRLFMLQVAQEHARSSTAKLKAELELSAAQTQSSFRLTQDAFEIVSDWHHFAILQALSLKEIRALKSSQVQTKKIAMRLRLQQVEVETAISRLLRIELIVYEQNVYRICHDTVFTTDGVPSAALRSFHSQVLKKAEQALELQSLEERYPNSIMLPILQKDFTLIKNEILSFQKKIMKKYGRTVQGDGEQVYALTQQFFKLTEEK